MSVFLVGNSLVFIRISIRTTKIKISLIEHTSVKLNIHLETFTFRALLDPLMAYQHNPQGLQLDSKNLNSYSKFKLFISKKILHEKYWKPEYSSDDNPSVPTCRWRKRYFGKKIFENTNFSTLKYFFQNTKNST